MPLPWTREHLALAGEELHRFLQGLSDPTDVMLFLAQRQVYLLRESNIRTLSAEDPALERYRELRDRAPCAAA